MNDGLSNSGSGRNMQYFTLKSKVDDQTDPMFVQTEKVGGNWQETNTGDTISGMLAGAKIETKEIKGMTMNFFVLFLETQAGVHMKVSMSHNQIAYNIINSIAGNCNKLSKYAFSVYKKQSEDGKYWNGKCSSKIDGNKTEWAIDPKSAPDKEPVMIGNPPRQQMKSGKAVWDYSARESFWEALFRTKIMSVVGEGGTASSNNAAPVNNTGANATQEDDLPF